MRKLFWILFGLVVVVVIAGAALVLIFDPNDYKDEISQQVQARTGQTLTLGGPIEWSLFPWLAVELNQARLSNPPGFGDQPMLDAQSLQGSVRLWPLLSGDVEIGDIAISDATLELVTNPSGQSNLDVVMTSLAAGGDQSPASDASASSLSTGQIKLDSVKLRLLDQRSGAEQTLAIDNLSLDAFALDQPLDFEFSGSLLDKDQPLLEAIQLNSDLILPSDDGSISLNNLEFEAELPGQDIDLGLTGDLTVVTAPAYRANLSSGNLQLAGQPLAIDFDLEMAEPMVLDFSLSGQRLDLNALLDTGAGSGEGPASETTADTDLSWLQGLVLDGNMQLEQMLVSNFTLDNVSTRVRGRAGVITMEPLSAQLYGGEINGSMSLAAGPDGQARWRLKPSFKGINIGSLAGDYLDTELVQANGDLSLDIQASGLDPDTLLSSLNGSGSYRMNDGQLLGFDINQLLNQLVERSDWRAIKGAFSGSTGFSLLQGDIVFDDGTLRTPGLSLVTDSFDLGGDGGIDLLGNALEYALKIQPQGELQTRLAEKSSVLARGIPISLGGGLEAPRVSLNLNAMVEERVNEETEQLKQRAVESLFERLRGDDEEEAEKADEGEEPAETEEEGGPEIN